MHRSGVKWKLFTDVGLTALQNALYLQVGLITLRMIVFINISYRLISIQNKSLSPVQRKVLAIPRNCFRLSTIEQNSMC